MNDTHLVGKGEPFDNLRREVERLLYLEWPLFEQICELLAPDELHSNESDAVFFSNLENGSNVRMIERGRRLGFLHESLMAARVRLHEGRGEDFDGDFPVQQQVPRKVDLPHAAAAEISDDLIVG